MPASPKRSKNAGRNLGTQKRKQEVTQRVTGGPPRWDPEIPSHPSVMNHVPRRDSERRKKEVLFHTRGLEGTSLLDPVPKNLELAVPEPKRPKKTTKIVPGATRTGQKLPHSRRKRRNHINKEERLRLVPSGRNSDPGPEEMGG